MPVFSKTMAFRYDRVRGQLSSVLSAGRAQPDANHWFPCFVRRGVCRRGLMKVNIYASGLVTRLGTGNHHFRGAPLDG